MQQYQATATLLGHCLRALIAHGVVEVVNCVSRSGTPDPPSEEEAPPNPNPVKASGRYPAGYKHTGTTEEIANQIAEIHSVPAKPISTRVLSMSIDAINSRARRARKAAEKVARKA